MTDFEPVVPPVRNPDVIAAIQAIKKSQTQETNRAVGMALNAATFLVAVNKIGDSGPKPNQIPFQAGRNVELFRLTGPENKLFLPLFTDLEELSRWTSDPVSGMVVTAQMAFRMTIEGFAGCIINPDTLNFNIPAAMLSAQPKR